MNNGFAVTFLLKGIFTTYDDFKTFLQNYTNVDKDATTNAYLYKYILAKFANSNVNYDTVDGFLRNFGITYEDNFKQFEFREKVLQSQYQLTVDELADVNTIITNTANNNNEKTENPLSTVIDYISNQVSGVTRENKLLAYVKALDMITNKYLRDFLDELKPHFMQVFIDQNYVYEEEK